MNFKKWGDTKRLVFESACIYTALVIMALTWDFWVNLGIVTGLNVSDPHPYSLGIGQLALSLFGLLQLFRMLTWWRYYE